MEMYQQFKIVFIPDTTTYELWITDDEGEWGLSHMFTNRFETFTNDGNMIDNKHEDWAMVSEQILWEIDKLSYLGYEFIGIERAMPSIDNI